jgi:Ras GTPase-activating-like protein IQGAP2/3
MAFRISPRKSQHPDYSPPQTSPLRHSSNASTNSSAYSNVSNPFPPSRTSTISSAGSSGYRYSLVDYKQGRSGDAGMGSGIENGYISSGETSPTGTYRSARSSLRPLPQPPSLNTTPSPFKTAFSVFSNESVNPENHKLYHNGPGYSPSTQTTPNSHSHSLSLSRADSTTPVSTMPGMADSRALRTNSHASIMSAPDLSDLKKSSTPHLRNLSRFARSGTSDEFSIDSPAPSVVGLHNRRQLKRTDSTRASKGTVALANGRSEFWSGRNWMDQQRQFLQAYEYLCHIGEAKEWIEDIIHKPIPPIVQLEEALRDGVTLAEIVQALKPERTVRIFRHPKLQFRHSDNINTFFRFLIEVELPELFRFELTDLYDKKNIPKVIYCIHALSWLLYRNGLVGFRIGNLVGQLQFEHHELEEMQKGLDKSGINMPSFSGMGASFGAELEPEPEPEPVESEEDRIQRELADNEHMILDLQAQMRGMLLRLRLGQQMQGLWDAEDMLIDLQARIRGDFARQISDYRLSMKRFAVNLQSSARGFLVRSSQQGNMDQWRHQEPLVLKLQSLIRAKRAREATQQIKVTARRQESGIRSFQAAIRGALERKRVDEQYAEARNARSGVEKLQAAARGMIVRRHQQQQKAELRLFQQAACHLQAVARGMAARTTFSQQIAQLKQNNGIWRALQALSQGAILRRQLDDTRSLLRQNGSAISKLQACARGKSIRSALATLRNSLAANSEAFTRLQSAARGFLLRKRRAADQKYLKDQASRIARVQAHVRGFLYRHHQSEILRELHSNAREVVSLQANIRAMLLRNQVGDTLAQLWDEEEFIEALQAAAQGMLVRQKFAEKMRFFKENMERVIKVQSFVRAKLQGQAYKSLTSGKNPPVGTVKGFVHLLNDSDFDFDEEIEFERLRKTVVQQVRQNEMADQYITQLDIKIALLVKNKITLDEVVKHQKHFGGSVGSLLTNTEISSKDPFDLKALNKNSRRKLEQYQEMFFVLQTQPQYLARMFKKVREQATPEKECERLKHLMMGLFGYAQKRREEYYLLKLMARSIKEEVDSAHSIKEYLRGNYFWVKVFGVYIKSPRDRKYLRDLLSSIIKDNIIDNPELDLESDPMLIYLRAIENEQLRTGQRSQRRPDIAREEAIRDPETKRIFIAHLQDLRDIVDQLFTSLEDMLFKMPYGVRYIGQQMFNALTSKFKHDDPSHILPIVGHWLWKNYLQPALLEPEKYGVVDRGLSPEHRKNLGEVVKVLGQIAGGRLFGAEHVFLQPLNAYIGESLKRLSETWATLIDVPDAEMQFDIDEFNDLYAKTKPTLYIKMADIFSIHHLVAADLPIICPNQDDLLRDIVRELGSAKNNESELMSVSTSEICLTLNPKLHDIEGKLIQIRYCCS